MNMVRFRLLAVIGAACLSAARPACALDPATSISQYNHTVWRAGDGLPDNFVQALLQTKDGYLWIGTAEGLVRFDGLQFTVFDTRNTPALRHNSVVALCELRNGALWVGTSGGGVATYENGRFTGSLTTSNGLPNNYVRSIYETRDGSVWITAHAGGLVKIEGGRILCDVGKSHVSAGLDPRGETNFDRWQFVQLASVPAAAHAATSHLAAPPDGANGLAGGFTCLISLDDLAALLVRSPETATPLARAALPTRASSLRKPGSLRQLPPHAARAGEGLRDRHVVLPFAASLLEALCRRVLIAIHTYIPDDGGVEGWMERLILLHDSMHAYWARLAAAYQQSRVSADEFYDASDGILRLTAESAPLNPAEVRRVLESGPKSAYGRALADARALLLAS